MVAGWPELPIVGCRSTIADCSWTAEGVAMPLLQSSIGNQQSAMTQSVLRNSA
jgi:hypothetical protein